MTNEKEQLHYSCFPDSGGPPDFVLPDDVESALPGNIVNREGFSELKRKSLAFKLNFPLTQTGTFIATVREGRSNDPGRIPCELWLRGRGH